MDTENFKAVALNSSPWAPDSDHQLHKLSRVCQIRLTLKMWIAVGPWTGVIVNIKSIVLLTAYSTLIKICILLKHK